MSRCIFYHFFSRQTLTFPWCTNILDWALSVNRSLKIDLPGVCSDGLCYWLIATRDRYNHSVRLIYEHCSYTHYQNDLLQGHVGNMAVDCSGANRCAVVFMDHIYYCDCGMGCYQWLGYAHFFICSCFNSLET